MKNIYLDTYYYINKKNKIALKKCSHYLSKAKFRKVFFRMFSIFIVVVFIINANKIGINAYNILQKWHFDIMSTINIPVKNSITILGNIHVDKDVIMRVADLQYHTRWRKADIERIKNNLLSIDFIKEVDIALSNANQLVINIKESNPFAIYQDGVDLFLVADNGAFISYDNKDNIQDLIEIYGNATWSTIGEFMCALSECSLISSLVKSVHYIGDNQWNIVLNSGLIIKLSYIKNMRDIQSILEDPLIVEQLYNKHLKIIDLR